MQQSLLIDRTNKETTVSEGHMVEKCRKKETEEGQSGYDETNISLNRDIQLHGLVDWTMELEIRDA